jgi:hypothetical protein
MLPIQALVEHLELVTRSHRALEIDVPGKHLGEILRQLATLPLIHHRLVERVFHHACQACGLRNQLRLLAQDAESVHLAHDAEAGHAGDTVDELDQLALLVLGEAKAVPRSGMAKVEIRRQLGGYEVRDFPRYTQAGQRATQRRPLLELPLRDDVRERLGLRQRDGGRRRLHGRQRGFHELELERRPRRPGATKGLHPRQRHGHGEQRSRQQQPRQGGAA